MECSNYLGVALMTDIIIKERGGGIWWARVGVCLLGGPWEPEAECPFDDNFRENYAQGKGGNREAALRALDKSLKSMSESLF